MTLSSMTGFARSHGACGPYVFGWEIKSVNAKGLDLRLRIPPGWDAVEQPARKAASDALARGTIYASLTVQRANAVPVVQVNDSVLQSVLALAADLAGRIAATPPSIDGLLAIKGVVEIVDPADSEEDKLAAETAIARSFDEALQALVAMRRKEGAVLGQILQVRLGELSELAARAEAIPGRTPEAIKARLAEQIATLLDTSDRFDPDRLHQEAVLIAAKADIREELDRIASHIAQVHAHLSAGGAIGRRLDFLAQELNREVNTTCSKSNHLDLTNIGLEMKNVVEQFREQVQNLE